VSALAGGTMFYRWRRMEEQDRGRVWRLYGWFTALMSCGSCFGVVAWAATMISRVNIFESNAVEDPVENMSLGALSYRWRAAFLVTYAIEFLCLSTAKLMVLDRLLVFAVPHGASLRKRWAAAGRVVMAAVVLGNAVGLAANVAAAVHYQQAADAASTASVRYAANSTAAGDEFYFLSQGEVQRGGFILSVQLFCEVTVLLLIVLAFVVVGLLGARRVNAKLLDVDAASAAAATGRALRLRMLGTTAFVFVAFLLRCVFSTMYAVAFLLRVDAENNCPEYCDTRCNNVYTVITIWISYTPEFQLIVVLISSPVALLVALWGMTTNSALQLMKPSK
jgi:hypothetical protein